VEAVTHTLAKYVMELSLCDYSLVAEPPSRLAAAALALSIRLLEPGLSTGSVKKRKSLLIKVLGVNCRALKQKAKGSTMWKLPRRKNYRKFFVSSLKRKIVCFQCCGSGFIKIGSGSQVNPETYTDPK
jgi:hypothetical protein